MKQGLLTISIILIVIGAIIWLVPWPIQAEPATNVVGQVLFWIGVALLIVWGCLVGYYEAKAS